MARREPAEPIRNRAFLRRLGDQRASTADRDAVIETLSRHCTEGRLSMEEFEDRVAEAGAAKTGNELAEALRDLPEGTGEWTASGFAADERADDRWYERLGFERPRPDEPMWPHHRPRPWWALALGAIVLVAVFGGHPGILFPIFWISFGIWFIHRRRWHHAHGHGGYGCRRRGWAGPPPPWVRHRWDDRDRSDRPDTVDV